MDPSIIAFGIILMVTSTVTISFFLRVKPFINIFKGYRIWVSFPATLFVAIIFSIAIGHKCSVEGPSPVSYIAGIVMCCVFCLILFVDRKGLLIPCCLLVLALGILLQSQFVSLAYESYEYYAIDKYTHKLMPKGCSYDFSSMDVVAIKLWHSRFTGIYKVKR